MRLHENESLYTSAIQFTAQQLTIPPEFVEKDYWVTFALHTIYEHEIGKDTVFKGGTALSKCYQLIERFSEDIDLVVIRREGDTDTKLKAKLKKVSRLVGAVLPEISLAGITQKMGMNRKTAHAYTKEFKGNYRQVRDTIILETTWLGYYEPYTTKRIISLVGQMMKESGQVEIANEYGMRSFEVLTLEPIRTICEKIMSLVRFSYSENPLEDLKKKIRHTYDLHQLLQQTSFLAFLHSSDFDEMLLKVANDDVRSFRNNNAWLVNHPSEALIFKDLTNVWQALSPVYNEEFRDLVYGELPASEAIAATLTTIKQKLVTVSWTIKIETTL